MTTSQAELAVQECMQGDRLLDDWLEELNTLVLNAGWENMTDKVLKSQIIRGCNNASCRAELARISPATADEAVRFIKQYMAQQRDVA